MEGLHCHHKETQSQDSEESPANDQSFDRTSQHGSDAALAVVDPDEQGQKYDWPQSHQEFCGYDQQIKKSLHFISSSARYGRIRRD